MLDTNFTLAALHAAKAAQEHIRGTSFVYHPEEAAVDIDARLRLPELINLVEAMVEEAKRDLATNPDWTGPTIRVGRGRLKELSNILRDLKG